MELTKEYFEQHLSSELTNLENRLSTKIETQGSDLKEYIHESFEVQQVYIDERFSELADNMRINERFAKHDSWIHQIAGKVGSELSA